MRAALVQLNSGDTPQDNLSETIELLDKAAATGAQIVLTPEVTNCVSSSRARQQDVLQSEDDDITLHNLRAWAHTNRAWLIIGSLALKTDKPDGRFANRSFLIGPNGSVQARYDKIHMFDVTVSENESYRESAGYCPGDRLAICDTPQARIGMTICYDLRFPYLYRELAKAGAQIITVPSAFSPVTGAAHWEILLRARAVETGAFILAPAQTGHHSSCVGSGRKTYGHSLIISPWGEVLADAGTGVGVISVDLDLSEVAKARQRIPAMTQIRNAEGLDG